MLPLTQSGSGGTRPEGQRSVRRNRHSVRLRPGERGSATSRVGSVEALVAAGGLAQEAEHQDDPTTSQIPSLSRSVA